MSIITGAIRGRITPEASITPVIYNVSCALANTEYSQTLSDHTKAFMIKARGYSTIKLAFVSGASGTVYFTVPAGTTLTQDGLDFAGTLYFQTSKASEIVEIIEWT